MATTSQPTCGALRTGFCTLKCLVAVSISVSMLHTEVLGRSKVALAMVQDGRPRRNVGDVSFGLYEFTEN